MMVCAIIGLLLAIAPMALACPMCASGGPADYVRYNEPLITDDSEEAVTPAAIRKFKQWSIGLDARTISAAEGSEQEERHTQSQIGVSAAFRPNPKFFLVARVPYSRISITDEDGHESVNGGLGDSEILASYEFKSASLKWRPAVSIGLKLPTGDNNVQEESEQNSPSSLDRDNDAGGRLEEHGQIGTGGWDGMVMAHLRRSGEYRLSSTIGYRVNGHNEFEYQFGSVTWFDLAVSRLVHQSLSTTLASRIRYTERSANHGEKELHSGGTMILLIPEIGYSVYQSLYLSAQCSLPIINKLYEDQSEKIGLTVVLTQTF